MGMDLIGYFITAPKAFTKTKDELEKLLKNQFLPFDEDEFPLEDALTLIEEYKELLQEGARDFYIRDDILSDRYVIFVGGDSFGGTPGGIGYSVIDRIYLYHLDRFFDFK